MKKKLSRKARKEQKAKEQKAKELRLEKMRKIAEYVQKILDTNVLYRTQILELEKRFPISKKVFAFVVDYSEKAVIIWRPDVSVVVPIEKCGTVSDVREDFSVFEGAWFEFVAELTKVLQPEIEQETAVLNVGAMVKGILASSAKKVEGQPVCCGTVFGTALVEKDEIYRKAHAVAEIVSKEDVILFSGDTFVVTFSV